MSDEIKIKRSYLKRVITWIHDTLLVTGLIAWLLFFGAGRLAGYYFDFGFVPVELTEPAVIKKSK